MGDGVHHSYGNTTKWKYAKVIYVELAIEADGGVRKLFSGKKDKKEDGGVRKLFSGKKW